MIAGLSEERVREIAREELAAWSARPERVVASDQLESLLSDPEKVDQLRQMLSRQWDKLGTSGGDAA